MRDKDLIRKIAITVALLFSAVCPVAAILHETQFIVSSHPYITFAVPSKAIVLSWKRYPRLLPASRKALSYPASGVIHIAIGRQVFVVSYLLYDPSVAAAQAAKYGEEGRIHRLQARPRRSSALLDYSGYHFKSARGLQIAQGTRLGKGTDGKFQAVAEIVASSRVAECDITTSVSGKSKAEVVQDLKGLRPLLGGISKTITIH